MEDEEDEEGPLDSDRLPDLLFRKAPQLLQYTAALRSRYGSEDDSEILRERRGEFRLESHIGTVKKNMNDYSEVCARVDRYYFIGFFY